MFIAINQSQASLLWNIDYGIDEYNSANYPFARDYFIDYLKSNPNDKDGYFWLGRTYLALGDKISAREYFKKAYDITRKEKNIEKIDFEDKNSNVEDYLDMAAMFFEAGNAKEADTYADMMLKIDPRCASAYFIKAKIYYLKNDEKKAIEYLNKAIIYNNSLLETNLAKMLDIVELPATSKELERTFALEAYFKGDIQSAFSHFQKALSYDKTDVEILNMLCDLYIKSKDLESAQKILDEIFKLSDNNLTANFYQARIYELKKDEKAQENSLLKAFKINPNNRDVLLALGNYYLLKKDYKAANKYFEILINVNDKFYEGYFGYAYSLINLGKTQKAQSLIRKINSLNSKSGEVSYLLSEICEKNGSYKEALDYIKDALEKEENAQYYFQAAKIQYVLKKYLQSLASLKDALQCPGYFQNKDEVDEYFIKNYLKIGDLENAQKHLYKKQGLDKNRIIYKYYVYVLYKLQGNDKEAYNIYAQLKKLKPNTLEDYIDLSEIFCDQKEYTALAKLLESAQKKFPSENELYFQMIKIYYLRGDNAQMENTVSKMQKI